MVQSCNQRVSLRFWPIAAPLSWTQSQQTQTFKTSILRNIIVYSIPAQFQTSTKSHFRICSLLWPPDQLQGKLVSISRSKCTFWAWNSVGRCFDSGNVHLLHLLHHLRHAFFLALRKQIRSGMIPTYFREQNESINNIMASKNNIPDCISDENIKLCCFPKISMFQCS
jgi:hypothetical protein